MPEDNKEEELEDILEEDELEEIAEEIEEVIIIPPERTIEFPSQEFDDNALLNFLSQSDSVSPVLEEVVTRQAEVQLESVARTAPSPKEEEESPKNKSYKLTDNYNATNKYAEISSSDDTPSPEKFSGLNSEVDAQRGLQKIKKDGQREDYFAPQTLEPTKNSSPSQRSGYQLRKFT